MSARSLSTLIQDFRQTLTGDTVSVGQLLEAFHERGIGFVLFLFAAPMALPLPVPPGINIALATPLILLTAQQAIGAHTIWLPDRLKRKTFAKTKIDNTLQGLVPWLDRMELILRPRLEWVTQDGPSRLTGVFGVILALTVCIPLPLTNTVPSLGIALMALGVTMRDGLAVLAGLVVGMIWVTILVFAVTFFGAEAVDIIKNFIKSMV